MNKITKNIFAVTMTTLIVFAGAYGIPSQNYAQADRVVEDEEIEDAIKDAVEDGGKACAAAAATSVAMSYISSLFGQEVPTNPIWLQLKEAFLDCMVNVLANAMIQEMSNSIVKWAQSGFDGNPAFVENPEQFLGDVYDRTVDTMVDQLNNDLGGLLCSPYKTPIVQAIIRTHSPSRFEDRLQCTFDEAVENLEGFLDGDFTQGGWNSWIRLAHNNPYGRYLDVELELDRRIASAVGAERTKILTGDGFMSWETQTCYAFFSDGSSEEISNDQIGEIPDAVEYECDPAKINTPGSVIETQINDQFNSSRRKLEMADELNEVISSMMFYLMLDILQDDEGLSGFDVDENTRDNITRPPVVEDPGPGPGPGPGPAPSCSDIPIENPGSGQETYTFYTDNPKTIGPSVGENGGIFDVKNKLEGLDGHYPQVNLEFDFFVDEFADTSELNSKLRFQSVLWIRNVGGNRVTPDPEISIFAGPNRTVLAAGENELTRGDNPWASVERGLEESTWYHFSVDYDANQGRAILTISDRDTGAQVMQLVDSHRVGLSFFPQDMGLYLITELENLNEDEHVPKLSGSQYENIEITFTPGDMVCDGRPFTGNNDGPPPPPDDTSIDTGPRFADSCAECSVTEQCLETGNDPAYVCTPQNSDENGN